MNVRPALSVLTTGRLCKTVNFNTINPPGLFAGPGRHSPLHLSQAGVKYSNLGSCATTLFNTPWTFTDNHLVAIFRTLGARLPRSCTLSSPTPDRHRMLIGLGFSASTTVWMVITIKPLSVVRL
jgi:hypothetical protein